MTHAHAHFDTSDTCPPPMPLLATCWHCGCEIEDGENCGGQFEDCCESCATSAYYAAEQARARDE